MKTHELVIDAKSRNAPDPDFPSWPRQHFGQPSSVDWPTGKNPLLYFYFWLPKTALERPTAFSPDDLLYMGERGSVRNFRNGWSMGKYSSRYHWLRSCQGKRIFAVLFKLPETYKRQDKRRSLEYCVARELVDRYGDTHKRFLKFTGRFDFRVAWLRAKDVQRDARRVLAVLQEYGL